MPLTKEQHTHMLASAGMEPRSAAALVGDIHPGTSVADPAGITSLAAPAGGTGAAAGGYDTAGNRDLMITSHNAIRTDLAALRTAYIALVTELKAQGIIS